MRVYSFNAGSNARTAPLTPLESPRTAQPQPIGKRHLRTADSGQSEVDVVRREYGSESVEYANALLSLGDRQFLANDSETSVKTYKRAAAVYERLGTGHELMLAMALRSISSVYAFLGNGSKAQLSFNQASSLIQEYQ